MSTVLICLTVTCTTFFGCDTVLRPQPQPHGLTRAVEACTRVTGTRLFGGVSANAFGVTREALREMCATPGWRCEGLP